MSRLNTVIKKHKSKNTLKLNDFISGHKSHVDLKSMYLYICMAGTLYTLSFTDYIGLRSPKTILKLTLFFEGSDYVAVAHITGFIYV